MEAIALSVWFRIIHITSETPTFDEALSLVWHLTEDRRLKAPGAVCQDMLRGELPCVSHDQAVKC